MSLTPLWNIYQDDLTYDIDVNLNMYADDHQFYAMNNDIEVVNDNLTHSATVASEWYIPPTSLGQVKKKDVSGPDFYKKESGRAVFLFCYLLFPIAIGNNNACFLYT